MVPDDLRGRVERWLAEDPDPAARAELQALLDRGDDAAAEDLADRFSGALEFGTAGLRGVLGAGPNRMNRAVVARATWGVASELLASVPDAAARGVVVAGDARRMSAELVEDAAAILAGAGLRVVLFGGPVPTPLVGFAVKRLRAAAGVVVTASHNPPEYNGYKLYWEDAVQIAPPVDGRIAAAIARAPAARAVLRPPIDELRARGLVTDASPDIAREYVTAILALRRHPAPEGRGIRVVYTPLHGVGDALARRALASAGFTDVTTVPEQQAPDPAFPTVAFPNPEEPGALDRALALAARIDADLVLANDPDADRLAVAIRDPATPGAHRPLTGNEVGVLLGWYLLTEGGAPTRPRAVVSTIVSTPVLGRIAADLGVRYEETLTGFKWIARRALDLGRAGTEFVFGFEEALGYSIGDVVHDKDGISAAVLFAELVSVLRSRGSSPWGELEAIARRYGAFASVQASMTRKGPGGAAAIDAMMRRLRASPPEKVGDDEVIAIADYDAGRRRDVRGVGAGGTGGLGGETPLDLPRSNVLAFHLASGARVVARPSGTEPKAKFYFDVCEAVSGDDSAPSAFARARRNAAALARAFMALASPEE